MQVQVDLGRPLDRGPRLWERLGGPRRPVRAAWQRAAPASVRRDRQVSKATAPAAPTATITPAAIRKTWTSSATAASTAGRPSPPGRRPRARAPLFRGRCRRCRGCVRRQVPIAVLLLLVSGGGLPALADLAGGPVDGAGAAALDAAESLAPRADLGARRLPLAGRGRCPCIWGRDRTGPGTATPAHTARAAMMARIRLALMAAHPFPRRHSGRVPGAVALGVSLLPSPLARPSALPSLAAVAAPFLVDAAGEPLAFGVLAGLVEVLFACIGQHPPHGVTRALPGWRRPAAATAQVSAGAPGSGGSGWRVSVQVSGGSAALPGWRVTGHLLASRRRRGGSPCGPSRRP